MRAVEQTLINLNAATEHELTQLPRVGADKARRIIHYRAVRKGFRDWSDFAGTLGIAEEDVQAIRTRAWIGPAAQEMGAGTPERPSGRRPPGIRRPKG